MSRLKSFLLLALTVLAIDILAAAPADAQVRRDRGAQSSRRDGGVLASRRSDRNRDDRDGRYDRRRGSHQDSDADSDSDSEDSDDNRGRRGRGNRDRRDRRDACIDVNQDGRCDNRQTRRNPNGRLPDVNYPTRYPMSQVLGAVLGGR
ncbi:MAG: hypothetical protein LH467_15825 [Gemmatimonadaceae bacterium]|nr:hypothetical protein [Gemmatimonadaceae bacterium]